MKEYFIEFKLEGQWRDGDTFTEWHCDCVEAESGKEAMSSVDKLALEITSDWDEERLKLKSCWLVDIKKI